MQRAEPRIAAAAEADRTGGDTTWQYELPTTLGLASDDAQPLSSVAHMAVRDPRAVVGKNRTS
eukprot:SAG31_NODE_40008_length_284_cov_0.448649_1_plen_62_part_10